MKLSDVTLPIDISEARPLAMVFTVALAGRLAELHAQYGNTNCIPVPTPLSDGRLALGADLLTEVMPGGLLNAMWAAADQAVLLASVDVVPWADIASLLPPQPMP